jgi:hypothetical protein
MATWTTSRDFPEKSSGSSNGTIPIVSELFRVPSNLYYAEAPIASYRIRLAPTSVQYIMRAKFSASSPRSVIAYLASHRIKLVHGYATLVAAPGGLISPQRSVQGSERDVDQARPAAYTVKRTI